MDDNTTGVWIAIHWGTSDNGGSESRYTPYPDEATAREHSDDVEFFVWGQTIWG